MIATVVLNLSGPYDTHRWIAPDIPVSVTAKDYFANCDPVMEIVYNLIRKDNQSRKP